MTGADVQVVKDCTPHVMGRIVELHGPYYQREWDFGTFFQTLRVTSEGGASV